MKPLQFARNRRRGNFQVTILASNSEANAGLTYAMGLTKEVAKMELSMEPDAFDRPRELELGDQVTSFVASKDDEVATLLSIRNDNLGYLIMA